MATETPEKGMEVLNQIPALNKKILIYLINFLQELAKPEYVEQTKMSVDNLSMVFAPTVLRCPYQDYNRVLASTDKQKAFMLNLFENVPQATKLISAVAAASVAASPPSISSPTSPRAEGWKPSFPSDVDKNASGTGDETGEVKPE